MSLIYLAICWFVGLWLAAAIGGKAIPWMAGAVLLGLAAIAWRRRAGAGGQGGALALACLAALGAGGGRYLLAQAGAGGQGLAAYEGEHVRLIGVVVEEPLTRDDASYLRLRVESVALIGGSAEVVQGEIQARLGRFVQASYGTKLRLTGRLQMPEGELGAMLARRGFDSTMAFARVTVVGQGAGNPVRQALVSLRGHARATIYQVLPDPAASLLVGILLGDDSGLSRAMEDAFRRTGMSHIIAISGFNITLLAGMLLALARPFLRPRPAAAVALAGVGIYSVLVGADPAVVRAAIMGGLFLSTRSLLGRPTFPFASLFLAGFLMTLFRPGILWDVGFQLSFAATLGLMLYTDPFTRWTRGQLARLLDHERSERITRAISDTVLVTLAAQVTTVPLLIYHFGTLSLASLPANLLVLPAQSGVMLWGSLATVAGLALPFLGQLLAWPAWLFLSYSLWMVEALAELPLAIVPVELGAAGLVGLYLALAAVTWLARKRPAQRREALGGLRAQSVVGAILLVALLAWQWAATQPDGLLHVHFLGGAQDAVVFIQTPAGRQLLVNGGPDGRALNEKLGRLTPFWDRSLDMVIATAPNAQRAGALNAVFDRYRVARLLTAGADADAGRAWSALLGKASAEAEVAAPVADETYVVDDGVRLEILSGGPSLSLRLTYGKFAVEFSDERAEVLSRPSLLILWETTGEANSLAGGSADTTFLSTKQVGTLELITDGEQMWWQAAGLPASPP